MATYSAADINTKPVPGIAQTIVLTGNITATANTADGDKLKPLKIPAGVKIAAVMIRVATAFGTTAPAKIGLEHVDGSAVPASVYGSLAADTCIAPVTDTSHASTGHKTLVSALLGLTTVKESYLLVTFGTTGTQATGVADYVVLGEFVGSK